MNYVNNLIDILDFSHHHISDIRPSEWAEKNMIIRTGRFQGPLSYNLTPFSKEILDSCSPYDPAQRIVLMGASQWGKSKSIIEPLIAYIISEHPCNILYLTGHSELSEESIIKLDSALDNSGLRPLISSQSLSSNKRSGDTLKRKEFPGGELISGSATNHKILRQRDPQLIIGDDIEEANNASKKSGATVEMIEERAGSYGDKKKMLFVSTPLLKNGSIIEALFLMGDQRRYHIPCQHCGTMIVLKWEGFTWRAPKGILIPGSVEYVCQHCAKSFDDRNKYEFNLAGQWYPTAEPEDRHTKSYHLPAWYKAPGMDDWESIIEKYLKANPEGQPVDKRKMQTFVNLIKGETYEEEFEELKANEIQKNIRDYEIGIIPERLSVADGNGKIVLVTCGADCNGIITDGRLDYLITAWAENGASYSVAHGSVGTFKPAILNRKADILEDREIWTYEENKKNCIWDEFEKILKMKFRVDTKNERLMSVGITGLDTGNTYKNQVYVFIEKMINRGVNIMGVKGRSDAAYYYQNKDEKIIHKGKEVQNLWTLDVGYIKDYIANFMNLKWNRDEDRQPSGFMNFPHPGKGLYEWTNFFAHFESEKRVYVSNKAETNIKAVWEKKTSASQNHMWDCFVYNIAIKEIMLEVLRINNPKWAKEIDWGFYVKSILSMPAYQ